MILNFKLKNFLSIKDEIFVSFEANKKIKTLNENKIVKKLGKEDNLWILKSLVFYGGNASGKTNIIKGLLALKELSLNSFSYKIGGNTGIRSFLLDNTFRKETTFFEINFLIKDIKFCYSIELNETQIIEEVLSYFPGNNKIEIFNRFTNEIKIEDKLFNLDDINNLENIFPRGNQTLLSILFDRISTKSQLIKSILDFFMDFNFCLNGMDLSGLTIGMIQNNDNYKQIVLDFLKNADINIKDIFQEEKILGKDEIEKIPSNLFINGSRPTSITEVKTFFSHPIYKNGKIDGEEKFDLSLQESEGTKRLFSLIGPIIQTIENNGILFIDEIDSHLHILLLENLIKFIHQSNLNSTAQFFFNIHNLDLLDLELFRKDQIWFAEKDNFGSTSTYSLDDFKDMQIRNNSDIKKAYKLGAFGGISTLLPFYM